MIARNGILTTLRAKGRTVLFTLLILALTLTLTLGQGMWAYCAQTLAAMEENYTSMALVEYMGADYPDGDVADEQARQAARELDGVAGMAGVTLWQPAEQTLAAMEGYRRDQGAIPYGDNAVVIAASFAPLYEEGWRTVELEQLVCRVVMGYDTVEFYGPDGVLQLQAPYIQHDGQAYTRYVLDSDGHTVEEPVAAEDLPESYWLQDLRTNQGKFLGPDLGWEEEPTQLIYPEGAGYRLYERYIYAYSARVTDVLFSQTEEGNMIVVDVGDSGFAPRAGERYLLHGVYSDLAASSNTTLALGDFYEGCTEAPFLKVSGSDDPAVTDSIFAQRAAYYQVANNYLRLTASDDIAALEAFHQNALTLAEGRFPQAGETGVCLLDGRTAQQMGLSLGDSLMVSVLESAEDDRFALTAGEQARTLTVVGITNSSDDYAGCLWVSAAEGDFDSPLFGYQLGVAVLENGSARQTADAIQAAAPAGVRVTLYDQGYAAAAQPLEAMRTTAMAVTAASACGTLAVLFLFAYLFVGRQKETVDILICLGTPVGKQRLWLLSGGGVIAAVAAFVGALAGQLSLGGILQTALSMAQGLYAADLRYSEATVGVVKELTGQTGLPWWPALVAGLAVFGVAMALCLTFLGQTRRRSAPKRGKLTVRTPKGGTCLWGRGPARFAFLSGRRGGWRSAVVPAAALTLVLLLGVLASSAQGWSRQMDDLYDSAAITGQATSTNGRQSTALQVRANSVRTLWQSGLLEDLSVSLGWNYYLYDEIPAFGNGGFAAESRANWVARQPELVALNSLSAAPAFYYGGEPEVRWLEGWDESCLADESYPSILEGLVFMGNRYPVSLRADDAYPCVVSEEFLARRGLSLGDWFQVGLSLKMSGVALDPDINLTVVGVYQAESGQEELYVPLSFWCGLDWVLHEDVPLPEETIFTTQRERDNFLATARYTTCRFTLASARGLEDLRGYLAERGFSQVGRVGSDRTTILLRDQSFTETVGGLGRYITFGRVLFPVLYGVVGLLGFVVSWLMVNGRRMEFAILRGLGASRGRVFWSFFLEQGGLSLAGCLLGCVILILTGAGTAGLLAALAFLLCYWVGCALSVLAVGRTHLMSLLSERE